MKKTLQIGNGIAFVLVLVINYLSNTGMMNNTTIGEISKGYRSLFTPAAYTFAIWGLIYLFLFGFVVFQGRSLWVKLKNDDFVLKTGWWFIASCVCNALWIFAWIYEYTGLSCVFIFLLLVSILKIIIRNRIAIDEAPFPLIIFIWWPFSIYAGWVSVASIANVSAYLVKLGWNGFYLTETTWVVILIAVAVMLNQYMLWKRHMSTFVLVGIWALLGIANANTVTNALVTYFALAGAAVLFVSVWIHSLSYKEPSIFVKFKQYKNARIS